MKTLEQIKNFTPKQRNEFIGESKPTIQTKCPYDLDDNGRCYYPINKKGKCSCVLRHHTASKTYDC